MNSDADNFEQTMPASIEAEQIVLASIFLDPSCITEVRGILTPDSFYQPDHKAIFESIIAVAGAGRQPEVLAVREHLAGRQILKEVGGNEMLVRLARDTHFTSMQAGHYAAILAEKAKLREIIRLCEHGRRRCFDPTLTIDPAEAIAAELERMAANVREIGWIDSIQTLEQIAHAVFESKERKDVERFPTGLADLDELIGGIPIGGMTLIAGKPGMGKSQLCKQIARNVAEAGYPVGIVAIEENAKKIGTNYLAAFSGIENSKIIYNRLAAEDWQELAAALPRMSRLKLYVDDAQQRLSDIVRTVRRLVRKFGCRMVIVDHLHLIDPELDGGANRTVQVTAISNGLKKMFKELNVAGIAAAQMNRSGSNEHDAPPELWNLRESGTLEADGDVIMQLHRPDYYLWKKHGENFTATHQLRIFVNKNKDGPSGWRDTYFNGNAQTVTDWNDGRGPNSVPDPFAPSPRHVYVPQSLDLDLV